MNNFDLFCRIDRKFNGFLSVKMLVYTVDVIISGNILIFYNVTLFALKIITF